LTPDALAYLAEATEQGASVHAIVTQRSDAPKDVFMHIANVPPEQLIADQTAITWFANRDGQVVAFLRPFSGPGFAKAIVTKLSGEDQAK
jgi:hypothetical protein